MEPTLHRRIDIPGELPIIASETADDDGDIWLTQGDDSVAMTREQAQKVRDALSRLLEPVF